MKMRPLPAIDLARLIHRPRSEMRLHLREIGMGFPPFSYDPMRLTIPDLLNEQGSLVAGPPTPWETIEKIVSGHVKKGEMERKHNLCVAKLMHTYALEKEIWSRRYQFFPLKIDMAGSVRYWWDVYYVADGRAIVPFVDPRASRGLGFEDRRVAFSFMNERIRKAGSDFEEALLAIIQFPKNSNGVRELKIHFDDGLELYDYNELSEMVRVLYEEWEAELKDRESAMRKASGTGGTLI
jgi:hypothetical protein